jgi:hypothetical protein
MREAKSTDEGKGQNQKDREQPVTTTSTDVADHKARAFPGTVEIEEKSHARTTQRGRCAVG